MDPKTNLSPELKDIYDRVMNTATNIKPQVAPPIAKVDQIQIEPQKNNTPIQTAITPQQIIQEKPPTTPPSTTLATLAGTIKPTEQGTSRKPLYIGLSLLFIFAWTGLWAVIFGFITI